MARNSTSDLLFFAFWLFIILTLAGEQLHRSGFFFLDANAFLLTIGTVGLLAIFTSIADPSSFLGKQFVSRVSPKTMSIVHFVKGLLNIIFYTVMFMVAVPTIIIWSLAFYGLICRVFSSDRAESLDAISVLLIFIVVGFVGNYLRERFGSQSSPEKVESSDSKL